MTNTFRNILDTEIPMLSGNELDGVSDWVDDCINKLNEVLYAVKNFANSIIATSAE